ncbi:MAG: NAD(P)H-dependent oxidoreductase [Candidatus Omnitrophica bacterium]|nr:NAD(P)H-dependent oxidoreductase [Candidatus Omnitrophota bacterium]
MAKLLIVYHSQSGNTLKLARAVKEGAERGGVKVIFKKAYSATLKELLSADGYCFGTPDYFSYMAGALKDFFDRTCYPAEGKITGRPYVGFVSHGGGGAAVASLRRMAKRFKLKPAAPLLSVEGNPKKADLEKARLLGEKLAKRIKS